jgi:SAM-dependent methyltransferase
MPKRFLHVGCGSVRKGPRTPGFAGDEWEEVRLDIDPTVAPDIMASITDLSPVATGSFDAVFSSHNIEHLYPHEAPLAMREFSRVLNDKGYLILTCPDMISIAGFITSNGLDTIAYRSGIGPISPLDMLYGHNASIRRGNHFMAHRTGFSMKTLQKTLSENGFSAIMAFEKPKVFELWAIAAKSVLSREEMAALATIHIPGAATIRERLIAD